MIVCIAVFKSKTEVFEFMNYLKSVGIPCGTTGTPKEAGIGCGLAVKFNQNHFESAKRILRSRNFKSFYAIYGVSKIGDRTSVSRIL